jgi:hypothetical protein
MYMLGQELNFWREKLVNHFDSGLSQSEMKGIYLDLVFSWIEAACGF